MNIAIINIIIVYNILPTIYFLLRVILLFLVVEIHKVTIQDAQGSTHTLNRYYAMWNKPRPESLIIVCISPLSIMALNEMAREL